MCNLIDKWLRVQAVEQENVALKRRIVELERQRDDFMDQVGDCMDTIQELESINIHAPMPCGHLARYSYPPTGDSGTTHFCLVCEYFATRRPVGHDESWMLTHIADAITLDEAFYNSHITDGFGNYWPRNCPKCGAPMVVIRPGDCRCSGEEH